MIGSWFALVVAWLSWRVVAFLLTWILAGLIVGWSTHARTIEGERDVNPKQEENGQ